jgi:CubicO group peptidase (beta-lactamase class C family)
MTRSPSQKLFAPLGIRDWSWETDGAGVSIGGAHLSLTAMDCARIGYLYLKKGDWFGTRVLPASWVEAATRTHSRPFGMNRAEDSGYGYLWWVDEAWDGFSAHGAGVSTFSWCRIWTWWPSSPATCRPRISPSPGT